MLRPVLGFQRLPPRALRTVADVLDRDETFRRRVAEGLDTDEPDRASWLFLTRPDGWAEELALLGEDAAEQRAEKERRGAERRAEQLSAALERRVDELEQLRSELESARAELADERQRRQEAKAALTASERRVESLGEERARAVRQLKRSEELATERLERLRLAEAEVDGLQTQLEALRTSTAEVPDPVGPADDPVGSVLPGTWSPTVPLVEVTAAVGHAARSAAELAAALADVAALLSATSPPPDGPPASDEPPAGSRVAGRHAVPSSDLEAGAPPSRRVPLRTLRGVVEDSPEGIEQLMRTEGLVTLVDGYNVAMARWPDLDKGPQRDSLVRALGGLAARVGAVVHVVFDGGDHGQRPAVGVPLPVRVHFSPTGIEADDVILEMVAELPTDSPVLVISSDRRVAQGSRRLGANTAGSDTLVELLGR